MGQVEVFFVRLHMLLGPASPTVLFVFMTYGSDTGHVQLSTYVAQQGRSMAKCS
jgi:hypothetical protein